MMISCMSIAQKEKLMELAASVNTILSLPPFNGEFGYALFAFPREASYPACEMVFNGDKDYITGLLTMMANIEMENRKTVPEHGRA